MERPNDEHAVKPGLVSLTESTELGTLYSLQELRVAQWGRAGRADCACTSTGRDLRTPQPRSACLWPSWSRRLALDLLSFGGTKNGLMVGEAVVVFDRRLLPGMLHLRKQTLQLASKMRFVAAQFDALLADELWLANASHANAMAVRLFDAVSGIEGVAVSRRPAVNAVFAVLPREARERLQQEFDFYEWDIATGEVRWMCSWDTTEDDVDGFAAAAAAAAGAWWLRRAGAEFFGSAGRRGCVRSGTDSLEFRCNVLTRVGDFAV